MMILNMNEDRAMFDRRLSHINWDPESGIEPNRLLDLCKEYLDRSEAAGMPRTLIAAGLYEFVLDRAQLEREPQNLFACKFNLPSRIIPSQFTMWKWYRDEAPDLQRESDLAYDTGCFSITPDFDHCTTDWQNIMESGIGGLIENIDKKRGEHERAGTLDGPKSAFYDSCKIALSAVSRFALRLAAQAEAMACAHEWNKDRLLLSAMALRNIAVNPPETLYEALQLGLLFYQMNFEFEMPLNSLGGIDRIYGRYYRADIENRTLTREQAVEMIGYFLLNCRTGNQSAESAGRHANNIGNSFFIGGVGSDGRTIAGDFSCVVLEAYRKARIQVPKISIRISQDTPDDFLNEVFVNMRDHNMHYVLLNDIIALQAQVKAGVSLEDACEYAPIGCYEPSVVGREIGSTGWPWVSMPKAIELALNNGTDPVTGRLVGDITGDCGEFSSFDRFYLATKAQLKRLLKEAIDLRVRQELVYPRVAPTPLLSASMRDCVRNGVDSYVGGAKYNNSSVTVGGLAEFVDSLCVIREFVYERYAVSLKEFKRILDGDWQGHEVFRARCLKYDHKWGNNISKVDDIGRDICDFVADVVNNKPNGRGGIFKAGLFGIILRAQEFGANLGALPSGRKAHEYLPRNNGASTGMDRAGVTGLIHSVTRIDYTKFPNGSVTDVMLHPSAIRGEDGLAAFKNIARTYFDQGGFGIQFNIFDSKTLKDAQLHPKQYENLQIRVSGWNVLFVNLCKEEQDQFIRQAECSEA